MELALYSMWSIDIRNLVQNKFIICREYNIQPSEIDKMQMFDYENLIEDIVKYAKKQEEQHKKEQEQYNKNNFNFNNYTNAAKNAIPKINMPKF